MLYLTHQIQQQITNLSFNADSENIYGYLLGFEKRDIRIIEELILVNDHNKNMQQKSPSKSYLDAELLAEEKGLVLLGILIITRRDTGYPLQDKTMISLDYFSSLIVSVSAAAFLRMSSWRFDVFNQYIEERIIVLNNQDCRISNSGNLKQLYSINYN